MPMQVDKKFDFGSAVFYFLEQLVEVEYFGLVFFARVFVESVEILAEAVVAEVAVCDSVGVDHGDGQDGVFF